VLACKQAYANLASCAGAVFCVAAGAMLASGEPLAVSAFLFPLGGVCDLADGVIARRSNNRRAELGAFIDSMCDKVGEAGLLLGLFVATGNETARLLVMVSYTLGALTSYTKAVTGEHQLRITWSEARHFGRAGRVILLSLTLIVAAALQQPQTAMIVGLTALATFNLGTFGWRVGRVLGAAQRRASV
jgi:phosphatidylglycerophosphate synthase